MLRLKVSGSNDKEFTKIIGNNNERTVFPFYKRFIYINSN